MAGHRGGRKRIPTVLHVLQGGSKKTHRALPKNEPKPPAVIPKCPKHLDAEARKEWRRMAKELDAIGILTIIDKAVFASYCEAWSRWVAANLKLQEQGMVFKTPGKTRTFKDGSVEQSGGGYPMLNPYYTVVNKENDKMMKALVEIGMSPSSRSRVKVEKKPVKDEAEEFLGQGNG